MAPTFFVVARLIAVILSLCAIGQRSHNYYILLRWVMFLIGAWGAYRAYRDNQREWMFVGMHLAIAVLFNPFLPFTLQKSTWTIFNIIAAWLMLMSIAVLEPEPLKRFMGTSIGNAVRSIFGVAWGIGLIFLGAFFIYLAMDPIMKQWWLWRNAKQAKAQITRVAHRVEEVETETRVGYRHSYELEYSFAVDNKTYFGKATLSDNPLNEEIEEEDVLRPQTPTYLDIEYQSGNPDNSIATVEGNRLGKILPALLLLAFGLWPTVAGVNILKKRFDDSQFVRS